MAVEQFSNGESLESVRSKLNANDVELDSRLTAVESQLQSTDSYYTKPTDGIPESDLSASVQSKLDIVGGLGTAATQNSTAFATASQGAKADTALQSIPVATATVVGGVKQGSGVSIAVDGTISATGTAAGNATSTVPGLVQLASGQSSVQLSKVASTGAYADLTGTPTLGTAAAQDISAFATAAQGAKADTALQVAPVTSVAGRTGAVTLTTSDVSGLGTAATQASSSFATAAQGAKADTALQQASGDARYVRTVNGTGPDGSGNVVVSGGGGSASFASLTGVPADNAALTTSLNTKVNKVVAGSTISVSGNMTTAHVGKVVVVDTSSAAVILTLVAGVIASESDRITYKRSGANSLSFASSGATLHDPHLMQVADGDLVVIAGTAADTATVVGMPADLVRKNVANVYQARQSIAPVALAISSGNVALNGALSNNYTLSLTSSATLLNPTNLVGGQSGTIDVTNTGSFTLSYGTMWRPIVGATTEVKQGSGAFSILTFKVSADATKILFNVMQEQ